MMKRRRRRNTERTKRKRKRGSISTDMKRRRRRNMTNRRRRRRNTKRKRRNTSFRVFVSKRSYALSEPKCRIPNQTRMFYTCSKCGKLFRQCTAAKHQKKCADSVMHCCDCGQEVKAEELSNHTKCPNGIFSSLPPLFNPNSVFAVERE